MNKRAEKSSEMPEKWYHGSPRELQVLKAGSCVTPFSELAKAYSHKPTHLDFAFVEDTKKEEVIAEVKHDGQQIGYLYEVLLESPDSDLCPSVEETSPLGEEMVTVRDLSIECLERDIQPTKKYMFKARIALLGRVEMRKL